MIEHLPQVETPPRQAVESAQVWIVIPVWNGCADTVECLQSLQTQSRPPARVLVVDNGSVDGTAEVLASRFPWVDVIRLAENTGYTGGCNRGMAHAFQAGADFVLLLNNDTIVDPRALDELVAVASSWPRAGIFSPLILYHAAPDRVWYGGGRVDLSTGVTGHEYGESTHHPTTCYPTRWANGCALLISRTVYEALGLLDPAYFASYEDVDFSLRATNAGFDVVVVPAARIWHKVSASWRGQGQYYYYTVRNRLYFLRKFRGTGTALQWGARLGAGALGYAGLALARRDVPEAKTYLFMFCGALAFFLGGRGQAPRWVYRWGRI